MYNLEYKLFKSRNSSFFYVLGGSDGWGRTKTKKFVLN